MTDRRDLKSNGHVAHSSLKGAVRADHFTDGTPQNINCSVADICREPNGARDRQLVFGEQFQALQSSNGWTFGYSLRDGYVGYVLDKQLASSPPNSATHRVTAPRTFASRTADIKDTVPKIELSFGSLVVTRSVEQGWAQVETSEGMRNVPASHLSSTTTPANDPAGLALLLLGTPYIWGGNSAFGVDCSGLIQMCALACGKPCPGDSDQQANAFSGVPMDAPVGRNDLFFWRDHVALAVDAHTLVHANAHHMAVAVEPLEPALVRIEKTDTGPLIGRGRLVD